MTNLQPVSIRNLCVSVQSRPVQQFDMLCFHLEVLCEQRLNFCRLKELISAVIQFDDAAVLVSDRLLARSKQKPCVILRTHGQQIMDKRPKLL